MKTDKTTRRAPDRKATGPQQRTGSPARDLSEMTEVPMARFSDAEWGSEAAFETGGGDGDKLPKIKKKKDRKGFAIMIGYPDATARAGANDKFLKKITKNKPLKVHHGGVIIVDENGSTKYFDFGRFQERNDVKPKSGFGVVRSSKTVSSLRISDVEVVDGEITPSSLNTCLKSLQTSRALRSHGYTRMVATVYPGVDAERSIAFARKLEDKGEIDFGGYVFGGENTNYCARFAREVAQAGGAKFGAFVYTGGGNVRNASKKGDGEILEVTGGNVEVVEKNHTRNKEKWEDKE